jgi:hypothetical protein
MNFLKKKIWMPSNVECNVLSFHIHALQFTNHLIHLLLLCLNLFVCLDVSTRHGLGRRRRRVLGILHTLSIRRGGLAVVSFQGTDTIPSIKGTATTVRRASCIHNLCHLLTRRKKGKQGFLLTPSFWD